jgi:hypothetical protein
MKPSDEDKAIHAPQTPGALHLGLEILVSEEDNSVYVKFTGFETIEDADDYALMLQDSLPLLLFESEIKH